MSRLQVDLSRVREIVLVGEDRACPDCGAKMHIRCCRRRNIHTFQGPVRLIVKLVQCRKEHDEIRKLFLRAMFDVFTWQDGQLVRESRDHVPLPQVNPKLVKELIDAVE